MSETINPHQRHPNCEHAEEECRVGRRHWIPNKQSWTPIYDGAGNMTNSDPNTFMHEMTCDTCGRVWQTTMQGGQTTMQDMTPAR